MKGIEKVGLPVSGHRGLFRPGFMDKETLWRLDCAFFAQGGKDSLMLLADRHDRKVFAMDVACVFPPDAAFEEVQCSTMGVFAPLVGVVGAMQAAEALKWVSGAGPSLAGRLLMLDGRAMEWNTMHLKRHPDCPVCSAAK